MCGILGLIQRQAEVAHEPFTRALSALQRRGPDQHGVLFDGTIALGHRRLSILDLSDHGKQPMSSETGDTIVVFNGEIYNHKEIRDSIEAKHQWQSRADTEVLVHGFEEWGQDLVSRIEGMFAFAVYDKTNRTLTCARDHFGKKPFYYVLNEKLFAFASEIKALLQLPGVKESLAIDPLSLQKYILYGYVPSPHCILAGIHKLEPSTSFQFDVEAWRIKNRKQFWRIETIDVQQHQDEAELLERLDTLLDASVLKRLQADVPVGVFLSGGVDSSLICHYVAKHAPGVESYTVSYESAPEADEAVYARRAAHSVGIKCNICDFEDADVEKSFVEILDYLDEPMADAAIIPLYFMAKVAGKDVTVVLSGDGGDELFGGYDKYMAQVWSERLRWAKGLAPLVAPMVSKSASCRKLVDCLGQPFAARQFIFGSGSPLLRDAARLMPGHPFDVSRVFEDAILYDSSFNGRDILNRSLFLDCKIQLPDGYLVKGDRATMAASLEMRNPLLDKGLAEFMFSVPGERKVKGGEQKYLLKKLAARYVDRSCIYRKKRGFGVPLDRWIRKELRSLFCDYLFRPNVFLDVAYVRKIHEEHLSGRRDRSFELLRVFNFNYFLERHWRS